MKLKCGVRGEPESDERPVFVCHHCGKPVCEEHGWVVAADDAFEASEEPVPRPAMHCPECVAQYHPRTSGRRRGWLISQPRAVAGQGALAGAQQPVYGPAPAPQGPYAPHPGHPQPAGNPPPVPHPQQPYPQQPQPQQPYPQQPPPPPQGGSPRP